MRLERSSTWVVVAALSATAWAQGPTTTRVSVASNGDQGFGSSNGASISANGRYVAFQSSATILVPNDTNGTMDVFRHDLLTGFTVRASVDSTGSESNQRSEMPSISADGRYVAFCSYGSNLVANDANNVVDVFRHDFETGITERVSVDSSGAEANGESFTPSISADGRYVAFYSHGSNLVANDTNLVSDVFRHDFQTGLTERVSVDSSGLQANGYSYSRAISADGRYIAFHSLASNLVANDTNSASDVFRRDMQAGITERASLKSNGAQANGSSVGPSMSADGRHVAFYSYADDLVPNDTNFASDVFRHDFQTGVTRRASVDSAGVQVIGDSSEPSISADGRFVAFHSQAIGLTDDDDSYLHDVFRRDFLTGLTERMSLTTSGAVPNGQSWFPSISADGRLVAFASIASNLVGGDTNGKEDVFVRDTKEFRVEEICLGDGTGALCPCKPGLPGRGCDNSAATGGALLNGIGDAILAGDTFQLVASHERASALSVFWQGNEAPPAFFGDGLRCVGGQVLRLYFRTAVGGTVMAPQGADPSISARSAAMGSPIGPGEQRVYQTFYRDGDPDYCPAPFGANFNATNGVKVTWGP